MTTLSIIGAGAWGTALAITTARNHKNVNLFTRHSSAAHLTSIKENIYTLIDRAHADNIHIATNLKDATQANVILIAVPAQHVRATVQQMAKYLNNDSYLVLCSKGIEIDSGLLMSQIVQEILSDHNISILSGPNFAREIANSLPAVATLANADIKISRWLTNSLSNDKLRLYASTDIIGLQIAGALKNVIAIAAGITIAQKLGDNARAALITRGLTEISRLGMAIGGQEETFYGLSGIGDLLLSSTSPQSRNYTLGLKIGVIGSIKAIKQIEMETGLTEGVYTVKGVMQLASRYNIDMPICQAVYNVLTGKTSVEEEIATLWARPLKHEYLSSIQQH